MANPFDPGPPGAPPPPIWGPPEAPLPNAPYAPARMSSGKKWLVGCLVVLIAIIACCGGTTLWFFRAARGWALGPIQAQAQALGAGDDAGACRYNSPTLQAQMDCNTYVAWVNTNAPFFAGATITRESTTLQSDATGMHVIVRVSATGPRGSGTLLFSTVDLEGHWFIDAVRP